ncbi:MAG: TIGR02281 family clan AA aspartic protease, partial [Caulobacterales bacterium]
MSNLSKYLFVAVVSGISALTCAQAVTTLAERAQPPAHAARADTALQGAIPETTATGPEARVRKSADGQYWANGEVNGASVRFLVDTGASA